MSAPRVHPTYVLPPQEFASKYVRRCPRCKVVRGNSAFRAARGDRTPNVCRFCEADARDLAKRRRAEVRQLPRLRALEQKMLAQLDQLRIRIKELEHAAMDLEQRRLPFGHSGLSVDSY